MARVDTLEIVPGKTVNADASHQGCKTNVINNSVNHVEGFDEDNDVVQFFDEVVHHVNITTGASDDKEGESCLYLSLGEDSSSSDDDYSNNNSGFEDDNANDISDENNDFDMEETGEFNGDRGHGNIREGCDEVVV